MNLNTEDEGEKKHLLSLFSGWVFLLLVFGFFSIYLYIEGNLYPVELVGPERMQDALFFIGILLIICIVFAIIWFFFWKAYWKNQRRYDSGLTAEDKDIPHSVFDTSLPLSLRGNTLYIKYGIFN